MEVGTRDWGDGVEFLRADWQHAFHGRAPMLDPRQNQGTPGKGLSEMARGAWDLGEGLVLLHASTIFTHNTKRCMHLMCCA